MGKKKDLNQGEKSQIHILFSQGLDTLEISKRLGRDHRTIQRYFNEGVLHRKPPAKRGIKKVSSHDLNKIKLVLARSPHLTSARVFEEAGVENIPKTTRNRILKRLGTVKSRQVSCPLTPAHRSKRLEFVKQYIKTDFQQVLFTDECRASLDGPDCWATGWVLHGREAGTRFRRQQGGGGVMFWAGIKGDQLLGPFRVPEGVKINSEAYIDLLNISFLPWYNKLKRSEKSKLIFMQDNARAHTAKSTISFLEKKGIKGNKIMDWPPNSPDLNPIENLWSLIKYEIYRDGQQFSSKDDLWEAIKLAAAPIPASSISKLTSSMDTRILKCQTAMGYRFN